MTLTCCIDSENPHTLIGHFKGRILRDISHLPRPSMPVDLWIIAVQQPIRRQIGYTFPRKCGLR